MDGIQTESNFTATPPTNTTAEIHGNEVAQEAQAANPYLTPKKQPIKRKIELLNAPIRRGGAINSPSANANNINRIFGQNPFEGNQHRVINVQHLAGLARRAADLIGPLTDDE